MFEKIGKAVDGFFHSLSRDVSATTIEPQTMPISVDYPEQAAPNLRLMLGVGSVKLRAGGAELVEGSITYNVEQWQPSIVTEEDEIIIKQEQGLHFVGNIGKLKNDWDLALGTVRPFALSISKGAGDDDYTLGGVPLMRLQIELGAGELSVAVDAPNPTVCEEVVIRNGAGKLVLSGLLHLNTGTLKVEGSAGELTLGFGGTLRRAMEGNITVGAGKITLNIPAGVPCRVVAKRAIGSVRATAAFTQSSRDVYETADYATTSGPKLTLNVRSAVGEVVINQA